MPDSIAGNDDITETVAPFFFCPKGKRERKREYAERECRWKNKHLFLFHSPSTGVLYAGKCCTIILSRFLLLCVFTLCVVYPVNEALKRPPPLLLYHILLLFSSFFFFLFSLSPNGQITSGHIATTGGMQSGKRNTFILLRTKSGGEKKLSFFFVIVNTHSQAH